MTLPRVVVAALLLLLLAACGSSSPSPTPSASLPGESPGSSAPSDGAGGSAGPSGAAELAALIPDEVGGVTLQKLSMRGTEFANSGSATEEAQDFLRRLGVDTEDVSVAVGFGASPDGAATVAVVIFKAEGADSGRLLETFKAAMDAEQEQPLEWESVTVGGKQVERAIAPSNNGQVNIYVAGDTLYFVATSREEDAAEILGGLP
ncbi:MAG TPA: hypothetical protein VF114_10045 [Candidatus Limnocylindria bacterium]